jgi:hypothetical protein
MGDAQVPLLAKILPHGRRVVRPVAKSMVVPKSLTFDQILTPIFDPEPTLFM